MLPGQMPDLLSDRVRLHVIHGGNGGGNGREESRMRICCGSRRGGSCRQITAVLKTGQRMCCLNFYWGPFFVLRLKAGSQLRPVLTRLNCCVHADFRSARQLLQPTWPHLYVYSCYKNKLHLFANGG